MNKLFLYPPKHLELIKPLVRWKILSLDLLNEASWKSDRKSNFYKTIEGFEKKGLIKSFSDHHSRFKYVHLTAHGKEVLGGKCITPINTENLMHDSYTSEFSFHFQGYPFTKKVLLEHEILNEYPMIGHRPDALIFGHHKKDFTMAIEMELTIKSKERILNTFSYYASSEFFNNVLYVFSNEEAFNTYIRVLENEGKEIPKSKFLFLLQSEMYRRRYDTFEAPCYHEGSIKTLGGLFGIPKRERIPMVEQHYNTSGIHSN